MNKLTRADKVFLETLLIYLRIKLELEGNKPDMTVHFTADDLQSIKDILDKDIF